MMKPSLISLGMLRGHWNKPKIDLLSLRLILRMHSTLTAGKPLSTLLLGRPPKTILELVFSLGVDWGGLAPPGRIAEIFSILPQYV